MILLQRPYMTQHIIGVAANLLQIETAHLEPTAIETGQQSEQGLVGLPKIKENIVAIARGIVTFLMSMVMICLIQMQELQAFFVLEVHASTALTKQSCHQ